MFTSARFPGAMEFARPGSGSNQIIPFESRIDLVSEIRTNDDLEMDPAHGRLSDLTTRKEYALAPLGDVASIVKSGGIFEYARKNKLV